MTLTALKNAKYYSKHITCSVLCNPHPNSVRQALSLSLFFMCWDGAERLNNTHSTHSLIFSFCCRLTIKNFFLVKDWLAITHLHWSVVVKVMDWSKLPGFKSWHLLVLCLWATHSTSVCIYLIVFLTYVMGIITVQYMLNRVIVRITWINVFNKPKNNAWCLNAITICLVMQPGWCVYWLKSFTQGPVQLILVEFENYEALS